MAPERRIPTASTTPPIASFRRLWTRHRGFPVPAPMARFRPTRAPRSTIPIVRPNSAPPPRARRATSSRALNVSKRPRQRLPGPALRDGTLPETNVASLPFSPRTSPATPAMPASRSPAPPARKRKQPRYRAIRVPAATCSRARVAPAIRARRQRRPTRAPLVGRVREPCARGRSRSRPALSIHAQAGGRWPARTARKRPARPQAPATPVRQATRSMARSVSRF